jgi:sugar lactone lactonase YvrE
MDYVLSAPEQITDAVAYHGEGPVWSPEWGGLRFVDMLAGDLLTVREDGSVDRLPTGSKVAAFVRPRSSGGYVVGTERGLALADRADDEPTPWLELWEDPNLRMNEGGCDAFGNLYAGNMAYDRTPGVASLFRITPAGDVSTAVPSVTTSNGFDISPDGSLAYYNDTSAGGTEIFDVTESGLANRRRLTVDLPVQKVTACTLGGPDGTDLLVTSSRENMDDPEPAAGAVFRLRVSVPGRPIPAFAG